MAGNLFLNVGENFDIDTFSNKLADTYRAKGYGVNVVNMNGNYIVAIEKDLGGINTVLGLGEGIKANIIYTNGNLCINYSDEEWTSKIIGLVVGWFCCLIPFITAIIGIAKQVSLPKNITSDATMLASSISRQ